MVRKLSVELFVILLVGLALGLFGPFGTYDFQTPLRLLYWTGFLLAGYFIFRPLITVGYWLSDTFGLSPFVGIALALVLASVPMTMLVALMLSGFDVARAMRWNGLGLLYFQVWLIGFLVNALFVLLYRGTGPVVVGAVEESRVAPSPVADSATVSPFLDQLPPGFGEIIAIKAEDHYVRVFSRARDVMILGRLRDAAAAMAGIEGMQVHRSWWVARAAVCGARREGRALSLRLVNEIDVPVAREMASAVRSAGWLASV